MAKILLVDDDRDFTTAIQTLLKPTQHTVHVAGALNEARAALERERYDMLFVDLLLPDGSGLELIDGEGPKAVVITGHPSIETAIRAVRGNAVDYLVKPLEKARLLKSIEAIEAGPDHPRNRRPRAHATEHVEDSIIGCSPSVRVMRDQIEEFGPTDITVLITGESGTGKELVARALHDARNADAPFVALNCGAIPQDLISSELFGHEKGSFTGATGQRRGLFERAGAGTAFLDEIAELPLQQQVTLLRTLETRTVLRVGAEREVPVPCRLLAATNRNLEEEVAEGRFREDLYYRLNVLTIHVPPLREREGDVELLANHYLGQFAEEHGTPAGITAESLDRLATHPWPGNIRELKHTLLRAAILNRGREQVEVLPDGFERPPAWLDRGAELQPGMSIREVERNLIEKTLDHFGGNRKQTAEALGVSLKTLYNRLKEYEDPATDS